MKRRNDAIVAVRMPGDLVDRVDAAAAHLGMSRSAFLLALAEAGSTRVLDPAWSCRTVHLSGSTLRTSGSTGALPGDGLSTEVVAPAVFWESLERAEDR